jgi:DNA polymerase V
MICLIDCDNFFASCETLFAPHYKNKPLVVVSHKNGIVIARSKEAKALKIPMGAASFEYKSLFIKEDVIVKQVNHTLYHDISSRVRETVATFALPTFIYSIDEMFIQIPKGIEIEPLLKAIQTKIKRWTGINTSLGLSKTKTLAKIATAKAKQSPSHRCILIEDTEINHTLETFPVEEIWGIGYASYKKLSLYQIKTAKELLLLNPDTLKKQLGVTGSRIVKELEGTNAYPFIQSPVEKSMQITKTFLAEIASIEEIRNNLGTFITKGCQKLRKMNKEASLLEIFVHSSRFKEDQTSFWKSYRLDQPSNFTPDFLHLKEDFLKNLIEGEILIKRAGVGFSLLTDAAVSQKNLFVEKKPQHTTLMTALDQINLRYGDGSLRFASTSPSPINTPLKSNAYTTCWDEICQV